MNERRPLTNAIVFFESGESQTQVYLFHTGWGDTEEWEEARQWFDKAWTNAFSELEKYVNEK
jgi:ribulose bisphosphate carboxylase small subunit